MYQKVNRNSLGQQLRRRERLVHASSRIRPAQEIEKDGVKHVLPPIADTRGIRPLVNSVKRALKEKQ